MRFIKIRFRQFLKEVVMIGNEKRGRPTENPKPFQMTIRYGEECKHVIEAYCKQENVKKMEMVRRGILRMKDDLVD